MRPSSKHHHADAAYTRGGHGRPPLVVAVSVLILLTGAFAWLLGGRLVGGHAASTQGSATLSKEPQTASLFIGGNDLVVAEEVTGISGETGLGAFSFTVLFSGQIVDVSISEGPFLRSTGRTTNCLLSPLENLVQFGCTSVGAQRGPTGSGVLAWITVHPKPGLMLRPTVGNGIIAVLDNVAGAAALSDPLGESIPVGGVGDAVVTVRALEGDLNKDCVVDVIDEQIISYRYQAIFGSLLYNLFYDLEPSIAPDGDIDIKDLQFVYGRDGMTCEEETPTPTPTPTPTSTGTPATATPTPTPTSTGTPATATPTPTPTSTGTPATATPTSTGTPATATPTSTGTPATATPTSTGTPATATPAPSATVAIATATSTPAGPAPTGAPVPTGTQAPTAATPTATPSMIAGVLPKAVTSPTAAVSALPLAGTGGTNPSPWATVCGLALALGGAALLYASVRLGWRATRGQRTDPP